MPRYALGLDYGTESARAILVNVETGEEAAQAVVDYPNGVIDEKLPGSGVKLGRDWALQDPSDWLFALKRIVPGVMEASGASAGEVVGIGVDFTACTVLPATPDGEPLSVFDKWCKNPNAWCKLWKHHAADPCVREIMRVATERGEKFLQYYGGAMSSEWLLPKALQIAREAPEIYEEAAFIVEGGDWLVWQLTGELTRNATAAGYKGTWVDELGYPSKEFLAAVDGAIADLFEKKAAGPIVPPGKPAGKLTAAMAAELGLAAGTPVSAATIDAHAGVPGAGVVGPGVMAIIMGTSSCQLYMADNPVLFEGFAGLVKDGIVAGYYGYESGQSAVGDIFAWFTGNCVPGEIEAAAKKEGASVHDILTRLAERMKPGESGLLALDWWNGNRSILMDAQLSGMLVGATLNTKPHEIYRALVEATAFGTRKIVESYENAGLGVKGIVACGGLAERNPMLMQINADVLNRPIDVAASEQTVALGAAMFGALAAGKAGGGHDTMEAAAASMVRPPKATYRPDPENAGRYDLLYAEYDRLHDLFGRELVTMRKLREWAQA